MHKAPRRNERPRTIPGAAKTLQDPRADKQGEEAAATAPNTHTQDVAANSKGSLEEANPQKRKQQEGKESRTHSPHEVKCTAHGRS